MRTGEVPREIMEQLAKGCFDAGLYAQSLPWAERLTRVDPHNSKYWHALGMVRRKLGDFDGAHEAQQATLAIDPEHAGANIELAKIVRDRELAAAAAAASQPESPEEDPAPSELPARHCRATWRAAIVAGTAAAVVVLVALAFVLGRSSRPSDVVLVAPGPEPPPSASAHPAAQSPDTAPASSRQAPATPLPASSWDGTGTPSQSPAPVAPSAASPQVAGSRGYGARPQRATSVPRPGTALDADIEVRGTHRLVRTDPLYTMVAEGTITNTADSAAPHVYLYFAARGFTVVDETSSTNLSVPPRMYPNWGASFAVLVDEFRNLASHETRSFRCDFLAPYKMNIQGLQSYENVLNGEPLSSQFYARCSG